MSRTPNGGGRSALEMLMHFEKVERDDEEAVRELVETACLELQIHSMLEEEIFYPAVRAQANNQEHEDLLNEAEVEHELPPHPWLHAPLRVRHGDPAVLPLLPRLRDRARLPRRGWRVR